MKLEKRNIVTQVGLEKREDGTEVIVGYPIVFNKRSVKLWDFYEVVNPRALDDTLKDSDVRAFYSHDSAQVLGREKNDSLTLKTDKKGLKMELVPPDTTLGRDVTELIRRGDVDGMSFGFIATDERWYKDGDDEVRELLGIDLHEVSPVSFPAYPDTTIALRGRDKFRDETRAKGRHPEVLKREMALKFNKKYSLG